MSSCMVIVVVWSMHFTNHTKLWRSPKIWNFQFTAESELQGFFFFFGGEFLPFCYLKKNLILLLFIIFLPRVQHSLLEQKTTWAWVQELLLENNSCPIVDETILLYGLQNENYHEVEGGEPGLYFAKSWIQPRMVVVVVVPPCESNTPMNFLRLRHGIVGYK
jgi:hypothetical protein